MPATPPLRWSIALVASLAAAASAQQHPLVNARPGALPIILLAPHGGTAEVPGVEPRTATGKGVVRVPDTRTDRLALAIRDELRKLLDAECYLLTAKFHRRYIDANRDPARAYESPAAKPVYDAYHAATRLFVDEVRGKFGRGLVLDIHGQAKDPAVVMRGTLNGRSVRQLLQRHGEAALVGPMSLFGQLERQGLKVFPANATPLLSEDAGFRGGFTVETYGSHHADGLDTIQLEFGSDYRTPEKLQETARHTAAAIAAFYKHYVREPSSK